MDGFVWGARENLYPMVKPASFFPLTDTRKQLLLRYSPVAPQENTWIFSNTSHQHFLWLSDIKEWIQDQLVAGCSYDTPVAELFFSVFVLFRSDTCLQVPLVKEMSDFAFSIDQNKLQAANL